MRFLLRMLALLLNWTLPGCEEGEILSTMIARVG